MMWAYEAKRFILPNASKLIALTNDLFSRLKRQRKVEWQPYCCPSSAGNFGKNDQTAPFFRFAPCV